MAEAAPIQAMNAGLNDAWFNPATPGQGFFIIIYPEIGQVFLAWFTYDTERPPEDASAFLGSPGQRWLTAQGTFEGNAANLTLFSTEGGVFDAAEPAPSTDPAGIGSLTLEFADCSEGLVSYEIPSLDLAGEIPIQRVAPDNIALCESLAAPVCTRSEPNLSHGPDDPPVFSNWIITTAHLADGGSGADGIPPIEAPVFEQSNTNFVQPSDLVVGVKIGDVARAYPHDILNWHEVVNDRFPIEGASDRVTLSYCPLTGSAVLWHAFNDTGGTSFGTSGLLFNSNLILYDRSTFSFWSQMLEQSVAGPEMRRIPDRLLAVETTWGTWKAMYPETVVLSRNTGITRNYDGYPYGTFREDQSLLFPVRRPDDDRLHRKERVLGINVADSSRVYPISGFSQKVEVINDTVGDMPVVVAGSSGFNFGVVYNRELEDCTVLDFTAAQNRLPVVMRDNEGNEWDVFGTAVSGPRAGQKLAKTNSYISYWFAWTSIFANTEIHP